MNNSFTGFLFYKIGILVLLCFVLLTITIFGVIDNYYTEHDTILDAHELYFYSELIEGWSFPEDSLSIQNDVDNLHFSVSIYDEIGGDVIWAYPDTVRAKGYISYSNSDTLGIMHNISIPLYVSFGSTDHDEYITWAVKDSLHYFLRVNQESIPEYFNYIPPTILSIIFLIILNLFIRKFLQPIQLMKKRIKTLKEGDLDSKIKIISNDELADLSASINKMISDIKSLLGQKQQLLLDVSHELRSPLARMRLITEMLPEHKNKDKMIDEIIYLEGMISNLLLSDKLSTPYSNINYQKIKIKNLLIKIMDLSNITLSKINIDNQIPDKYIIVDETKMIVAIRNLIDNANKYGNDTIIDLKIFQKENNIQISISNQYEKINEDELKNIFLPFYRMQSTKHKAHGFGLGLTICKKIIEAHNGTIDFDAKNDEITFHIIMPYKDDIKK